ncbi:hypothetical protein N9955_00095 [bacterium]|nr:hypothetical protein [bacterium]
MGEIYLTRKDLGESYKKAKTKDVKMTMFLRHFHTFDKASLIIFTDEGGEEIILKEKKKQ